MSLPQAANSSDITSVIASLSQRHGTGPKEKIPGPKRAAMLMLAPASAATKNTIRQPKLSSRTPPSGGAIIGPSA